jgi:RNA polymerase sigma factor (sigma-70 family)
MSGLLSLFQRDEHIVESIRQGDDQTLTWLYNKHLPMIVKYIKQNHGDGYDASELLQDALVILWEKIRRREFVLESRLSTFLYAVVKNKWLQELARRKKLIPLDQLADNPGPDPPGLDQLQDQERVHLVRKCLEMLSPLCQKIMTLFYYEEKSMAEIARLTGLANEDVVKSKKYQCKKDLELLLKSAGY